MSADREPRFLLRPITVVALVAAAGVAAMIWRFAAGLGAVTNLNDGYPWGIWIAYDDVIGTALAGGGYAVALLVFIANRGRYHPLVRPALLASALGYTLASLSVFVDIGRPWNAWRILLPWGWNARSPMLEVAICVVAYAGVLWLELAPAAIERWRDGGSPRAVRVAARSLPIFERALPWAIALGLLLATAQQSSLGALLLVARTKLHPLWHTPLLPLLFLGSTVGMGYAAVVVEHGIARLTVARRTDDALLGSLTRLVPPITFAWIALRFADLGARGRLGMAFAGDRASVFLGLETALMALPAIALSFEKVRARSDARFLAAIALLAAGALYRFDAFLLFFNPGPGWSYFPSVPELVVTLGIVALDVLGYAVVVQRFPILGGAPRLKEASS